MGSTARVAALAGAAVLSLGLPAGTSARSSGMPTLGVVRPAGSPQLDPRLAAIARVAHSKGNAAALVAARGHGLRVLGQRVRAVVDATSPSAVRAAITAAGGTIVSQVRNSYDVLVPPASLETLAAAASVVGVAPPHRPFPLAVVDEGVAQSHASVSQAGGAAGSTGAGVKVGIVDLGFAGYTAAQASGDLPASVTTQWEPSCSSPLGDPHGTAVASIVHAMAPDAQLYLICIGDENDLALAETYAESNGIKIINHSIGWFDTGRGDGTLAADAYPTPDGVVRTASQHGILWVNAAGNEGLVHWGGSWNDSNGNGYLDFTNGNDRQSLCLAQGQTIDVFLKWDDWQRWGGGAWPTSNQDFDIFLFDPSVGALPADPYSSPNTIAWGEDVQDGSLDQTPTEEFQFTAGAAGCYSLAIGNYSADRPVEFDLFVAGINSLPTHVVQRSIVEPATSPYAMAVGAICWSSFGLEPYSGQGPTIDFRTKPDIAGFDATSSWVYGPSSGNCASGFTGTSAAAPHVAGAAALLWAKATSYSAAAIEYALQSAATDAGPPGNDNAFGYGFLWVPSAPAVLTGAPTDIQVDTATVAGVANPNGLFPTSCVFEYGPTTSYGSSSGCLGFIGSGRNGMPVTSTLYGLSPGATFHYRIRVTTDWGTTLGADQQLTTPIPPAPQNTVAPTLTSPWNVFQAGWLLTTTVGSWTGGWGTTITRTVQRCNSTATTCTDAYTFSDPFAPNYDLTAADVGSYLRLSVTVADAWHSTTAYSPLTPKVVSAGTPVQRSSPFLPGPPTDAWPASGDPGLWAGTGITESIQWQRCDSAGAGCVDIVGATGSTYQPTVADWHRTLRIKVFATGPDATVGPVYSAASAVTPSEPPVNLGPPTISGTLQVGHLLTASPATWQVAFVGATVTTYSRWLACAPLGVDCSTVVGTGTTFTPATPGTYVYEEIAVNNFGAGRSSIARSAPVTVIP